MKKTIFFMLLICSILSCNSNNIEQELSNGSKSSKQLSDLDVLDEEEEVLDPKSDPDYSNESSFLGKPLAKHVIVFALDGWAGNTYEKADMPNVKYFANNGSYTLKKRAVMPSSSAVNWATMFMGAGPEVHGYNTWGSTRPDIPAIKEVLNENTMFPTIFYLEKDQYTDMKVACIYEWSGIKYLVDETCLDHSFIASSISPDVETFNHDLKNESIRYIKAEKPNLFAIIWDNPDKAGHKYNWGSELYYAALAELDRQIGEIVEATKEVGIYDETIFIITSDHGGIGDNHGGTTLDEVETPFIIFGNNIKSGHIIQRPMIQYDVAATMATVLGVRRPDIWRGQSMNEVFSIDIKDQK